MKHILLTTICSVDLTVATRVHIVEPGWNPMLERQALDRVHRLGQTKEVTSISYVVSGSDSVEEVTLLPPYLVSSHLHTASQYIRKRQEWKSAMITASLGSSDSASQQPLDSLLQVSSITKHKTKGTSFIVLILDRRLERLLGSNESSEWSFIKLCLFSSPEI